MYDAVMPGAPYWMGAVILGVALILMQVRVSPQVARQMSVQPAAGK
ncbi:MAG: hypothetical protein U0559_00370 [Anaerolineae bacterium]